jgi:hypothetical protein
MISYKDMTFCTFYKSCADGDKCFRACTPETIQQSVRFGLPISSFCSKPDCFKKKEEEVLVSVQ